MEESLVIERNAMNHSVFIYRKKERKDGCTHQQAGWTLVSSGAEEDGFLIAPGMHGTDEAK
jgi:hypothetical protein